MLYLIIPVFIGSFDLLLKGYVERNIRKQESFEILRGRILIRKSHNTGAMMNLLDKHQGLVTRFSLGIFLCTVIYYGYLISKKGMFVLKAGLSFIIGGAISNIYDRVVRKYVVDYFSFNTKNRKIKNIVFNIADIFIFLGSFLVILWNTSHKS